MLININRKTISVLLLLGINSAAVNASQNASLWTTMKESAAQATYTAQACCNALFIKLQNKIERYQNLRKQATFLQECRPLLIGAGCVGACLMLYTLAYYLHHKCPPLYGYFSSPYGEIRFSVQEESSQIDIIILTPHAKRDRHNLYREFIRMVIMPELKRKKKAFFWKTTAPLILSCKVDTSQIKISFQQDLTEDEALQLLCTSLSSL